MAERRDPREFEKELRTLKGRRTSKKGAVTTRIRKLDELVDTGGSRRVIASMVSGLLTVFEELKQVCDTISSMIDDFDELNELEEIRLKVEICVATATENLDDRRDDPPSTETSSWVAKHAMFGGAGSNLPAERGNEFVNLDEGFWPESFYSRDGGIGAGQPPSEKNFRDIDNHIPVNSNFSDLNLNRDTGYRDGRPDTPVRVSTDGNLLSCGVYEEHAVNNSNTSHANFNTFSGFPGMLHANPHPVNNNPIHHSASEPRRDAAKYVLGHPPGFENVHPGEKVDNQRTLSDVGVRIPPRSRPSPRNCASEAEDLQGGLQGVNQRSAVGGGGAVRPDIRGVSHDQVASPGSAGVVGSRDGPLARVAREMVSEAGVVGARNSAQEADVGGVRGQASVFGQAGIAPGTFQYAAGMSTGDRFPSHAAGAGYGNVPAVNQADCMSRDDAQSSLGSSGSSSNNTGMNHGGHYFSKQLPVVNEVDSWIDDLAIYGSQSRSNVSKSVNPGAMMSWMVQQHLPKMELPSFDGSAGEWVDFITKFRDLVHNQEYLNDFQRMTLLLQQLRGEAKRSVKGFVSDSKGYVLALVKLKKLFGQRPMVARAVLAKVTKGKSIPSDDLNGLTDFLYCISDCLITLKLLNYNSDLHSSDTLQQALQRLPHGLLRKWSERSFAIRRQEEPSLVHLEAWLQDRVMAMKEMSQCVKKDLKKKKDSEEKFTGATMYDSKAQSCLLCGKDGHKISKCFQFKDLPPDKRAQTVRNLKLCFNCLSNDHPSKECSSEYKCFKSGCGRRHHTTLHEYFLEMSKSRRPYKKDNKDSEKKDKDGVKEEDDKKDKKEDGADNQDKQVGMTTVSAIKKKEIILQIVPVTLHSADGKSIKTHAMLDTGSMVTLIREDVASELGLEGEKRTLPVKTIKDKAEQVSTRAVTFEVSGRDSEVRFKVEEAFTCKPERFNMPRRPRLNDHPDAGMYEHLEGLDLEEVCPDDVTILIGGDVPDAHTPVEVRKGTSGQPVARKMPFGWCLFGPSVTGGESVHCGAVYTGDAVRCLWDIQEEPPVHVGLHMLSEADQALHKSVERFWEQEHCGIVPPKDVAMSREDEEAAAVLDGQTKNIGNRYEVPMLWTSPDVTLPNNYPMALRRFNSTKKRLRANPVLYQGFKSQIDAYLAADPPFARKMSPQEARKSSARTWHLPVHPVLNPNKPGKTRLVNDAAAEFKGKSLNNSLVTGPDLLNSLVGVLLRFRTGRVAIAADIEGMYHQVRVNSEDADSLRFLWQDDITSDDPPDTYQMLVHIFGAKDSSTCCSYALKKTARDNWLRFDPLTLETVLRCFYVDDLLKSLFDEETAALVAKQLIDLLRTGGFRLCKFVSNCPSVLKELPESELAPSAVVELNDGASGAPLQRALGISWDTREDVFTFSSSIKDAPMTKRGILSVTSSLFDPTGFLTPFILKAKILLQELWRTQLDWDEVVDENQRKHWKKWLEGATEVCHVRLSRWYLKEDVPIAGIQLHIFCDASELAYGCVGYLRYEFKESGYATAFVMSKSRLAPIKSVTLPRLELNAARSGARMSRLILSEIDLAIDTVRFWSDSTLTLQYINNDKHRLKTFVANRTTAILESSDASQWSHISGDSNPADLLTRGVISPVALNSSSWFNGPDFLTQEEDTWPKSEAGVLSADDVEIRQRSVLVALGLAVETGKIDMTRFSTWLRLKRVVAWMIRFFSNSRKPVEDRDLDCLTVEEISDAEHVIVKDVQVTAFDVEISSLVKGKPLPKSSKLLSLSPFLDNQGVLRVGGRLGSLAIPESMKHPPILDRMHPATKLLIDWTHRRNGHVGTDHVLAIIRESYWILGGRIAINQVVHNCFFCRVKRAKVMFPFMADLPQCRAAIDEPPFSHCGVDLFGPVLVKQGRKRLKRWVCLFTCLTVRCIHLEIVEDCETDSFINAIRRFVNRRGCPSNVYSDNGTNFKGATSELKEFVQSLDENAITDFASSVQIQWSFNPPKAPHMGGAWERLVRSVKEVMHGLVQDTILTDPQLVTLATEAESIVNSRPLTYLSEDPNDLGALTPNHILLGRHRNWASIADVSEVDLSSRRRYKQVQALAAQFWTRWRTEYLPTLTTRPKGWRTEAPNFLEGDLVLLKDDDFKRRAWPLARIVKVMPGRDGVVRVAEVRTAKGTYTRPIAKLLRLEDDFRQGGEYVANGGNE